MYAWKLQRRFLFEKVYIHPDQALFLPELERIGIKKWKDMNSLVFNWVSPGTAKLQKVSEIFSELKESL